MASAGVTVALGPECTVGVGVAIMVGVGIRVDVGIRIGVLCGGVTCAWLMVGMTCNAT